MGRAPRREPGGLFVARPAAKAGRRVSCMRPEEEDQAIEADGRFPSGPWIGYYQQWSHQGRQRLVLAFRDVRISGTGSDPGGSFGVTGLYDTRTGAASLIKEYRSHRVEYD